MKNVDRQLLGCAKNGDLDGVMSALDAETDINIQSESVIDPRPNTTTVMGFM